MDIGIYATIITLLYSLLVLSLSDKMGRYLEFIRVSVVIP